jgi:hypothetical protein
MSRLPRTSVTSRPASAAQRPLPRRADRIALGFGLGVSAALLIALSGAPVHAAPAPAAAPLFKPGLWEITNKAGGANGGQMNALLAAAQQQMAGMDPAQRSKIEAMMSRNGVVINSGGIVAKACITPAMAARQQMPVQQKGNCTYRADPPAGNTMHYAFSCSDPVASGDGTAVFSSGTSYTATTQISGGKGGDGADGAGGGQRNMTIESTGRWLGSDCGNIAPADNAR